MRSRRGSARYLFRGLHRGDYPDTGAEANRPARLVDTLDYAASISAPGAALAFGRAEHKASYKDMGTALGENGT